MFDAVLNRHAYATTHGDILLHFFRDGEMQGSVLSQRDTVRLDGEITSTSGDIALIEDGEVVASWQPQQASSFRFDATHDVEDREHYFYVRVTLETSPQAWSSPIWVNYPTETP